MLLVWVRVSVMFLIPLIALNRFSKSRLCSLPGWVSATATISITILDSNDNRPEFDLSSYNFAISETASLGHLVGRVLASDVDSGNNSLVTYFISSTEAVPFGINSSTG